MWERACPAKTGGAGAIHRVGFFAGTPASTGTEQASGLCSTCGDNCLAQHPRASAVTVGAGLPREHRRSRCHSPCDHRKKRARKGPVEVSG
ncbi:hypothetical protein C1X72_13410 [Pseudomonas sp. FW306-2-2C-D06B]|nr:hypothetical protein C1X72_13410 [Pseudomonas sp. FW306-2-2C-D06B]